MKKTVAIVLFFLFQISFSQQNLELISIKDNSDLATLAVKSSTQNLAEGFTIEVANYDCEVSQSKYLKTPVIYNSLSYSSEKGGFTKVSDSEYKFETPFSIGDLKSKWFRWRVITNNETSEWKCFSWSDYCESNLNAEGKCE